MSVAVSVIVPVYNTARYLNQCVDSIINQTLKDIEIIFVDDGSTDNSVEILRQYQAKDNRIQIIQQQNQYAGVARNRGMQEAKGKYLSFLDSDDFFDLNMLKDCYLCAEKNQADIVIFGYKQYDDKLQAIIGHNIEQGRYFPKGVFAADDLGENLYQAVNPAPWNKLFRREFVEAHHLRFEPIKKSNDMYFTFVALPQAERMVYLDKKYVTYRSGNPESIQGKTNMGRETFVDVSVSIKKGLQEIGKYNGDIKQSFLKNARGLLNLIIDSPYDKEMLEKCYLHAKEQLIPNIFDSAEEFGDCYIAQGIYESEDYSDFLGRQLVAEREDREKNYIIRSSWEARVGKLVLKIPKKIVVHLKGY